MATQLHHTGLLSNRHHHHHRHRYQAPSVHGSWPSRTIRSLRIQGMQPNSTIHAVTSSSSSGSSSSSSSTSTSSIIMGSGDDSGKNAGGGGGGGRSGGDAGDESSHGERPAAGRKDLLLKLLKQLQEGWRARVEADPQFPFKVLMEQVVGVGANVVGDMATRPGFGLQELDLVFSTLVVGSLLNFALMYILAPSSSPSPSPSPAASAASAASSASGLLLPGLFAPCPAGHMFEAGPFMPLQRAGTFVYKGALFAIVGFSAGLLGTFISNGLIAARRKLDPAFQPQNRAPPPLLNASTWALHMGLSSNLRYQALNGLEFAIAPFLPSSAFKASVLFLRAANNLLGGMSFVLLAKLTGSQKLSDSPTIAAAAAAAAPAAAAAAIAATSTSKHHQTESQT